MTTENANEMTEEMNDEVVKAPKEPKVVNIVTMEDGTSVNFGVRANLVTAIDVDSSTLIFKLITGKVINYVVEGTENLTDFQKTVFLYGLLQKVKTSLAPVPLTEVDKEGNIVQTKENAILEQLESIGKQEFNIRATEGEGEVTLTDLQRAYAIAMREQGTKPEWTNLDDTQTISEVLTIWESKTAAERGKIRRHPVVSMHLAIIQQKSATAEDLLL